VTRQEPTTSESPGRAGPLFEVRDLTVEFAGESGPVPAVRGLSYTLSRGEVLGIVGESGSGKSVSALAVMGLLPPSATVSGNVRLRGEELLGLSDRRLARIRGSKIAMVFQDPLSALTPVHRIGDQIAEAVRIHQGVSAAAAHDRAVKLLDAVGIPNAAQRAKAYPHEFSGGMRQRVMIAMAIANDPDVLIADEPTTALDVTVQAQVLDLLEAARRMTGAATVMITHDLAVVAGVADHIVVMYAGRAVESGPVVPVYADPRMPYTIGLLGSVPRLDRPGRPLTPIEGAPPDLARLPQGCPFVSRCPVNVPVCRTVEPVLEPVPDSARRAACHRRGEIAFGGIDGSPVFPLPEIATPREQLPRDGRPAVLEVCRLVKRHPITRGAVLRRRIGTITAVDGISFDIREGEALGLVGESGCGKTTTIMQLLELAAPEEGRVSMLGRDVASLGRQDRKHLRREVQVVFQDPFASLDPRLPVGDIIAEPLRAFGVVLDRRRRRVRDLLDLVGLSVEHANRYPADLSGGQRQRIAIARAGPGATPPRARRTGVRSRRLHPGRRAQPARAPQGPPGAGVPVRRPRPVGGPPRRRPGRSDVFGPARGGRRRRRGVRTPGPSVHAGAAERRPHPRAGHGAAAHPDPAAGRPARSGGPAVRLPVPVALPAVRPTSPRTTAALQRRRPTAGAAHRP
jgi:peptide/nickel transport system ATP-binding protein